jgi:hypothetical protein
MLLAFFNPNSQTVNNNSNIQKPTKTVLKKKNKQKENPNTLIFKKLTNKISNLRKDCTFLLLEELGSAECSNRSLETEDVETHHHAMPASTTHPLFHLLHASSLPQTWVQEDPTQQSRFCFQFFDDPTRRTWLGGSGFVRQRIFSVCNNNFLSLLSRFRGHMAIPILACCNPFLDHQALACLLDL